METLRIHVERIIRPIRASVRRKNRMREEILGHLTRKAQTALCKGASESDAHTAAIEQFGDLSALRQELQASVPRVERLMYAHLPWANIADAWFDKQEGETAVRFALRRTAYTSIFLVVELCAIIAVTTAMRKTGITLDSISKPHATVLDNTRLIAALCGVQALGSALAYYLADKSGLRAVLARRNNSGAWRKATALYLFIAAQLLLLIGPLLAALWVFLPERAAELSAIFSGAELRRFLLCALFVVSAGFPFIGLVMTWEHKQYERWGWLRIEE